uniref:OSJNBa0009P12.22 protein n=2 Tax=Oryza sativa TaxID=4530 RepID=H2VFK6_ORYSJ|nr:OSJNBa0006A01.2 [Oryza sativa Japonica Group]CAH68543.2 OSJNBa0009P12.22 [Oryza sativa Japonica Group]
MAPAHRHTACCALRSTPAAMLWGISYVLVKQLPGVEEKSPSSTTLDGHDLAPTSWSSEVSKALEDIKPTLNSNTTENAKSPHGRRWRRGAEVVSAAGGSPVVVDGGEEADAMALRDVRYLVLRLGDDFVTGNATYRNPVRTGPLLIQRGVIPDHARPEQQQQPVQDTVPLQHARMVDMGGGVMAPMPAPSTHYPARDRELLAGSAGAGAGEEEPSADAAVDEEVERKGAALAASSAWSTTSTYLASMLRRRRKRPPATSSDVAWTVEDAVVNDELRSGTWMTKDTPVGEELRRGMWMTKDTTAGDEL